MLTYRSQRAYQRLALIAAALTVSLRCRTADPGWYTEPITEKDPFHLILGLAQPELHHGDTVEVTLTLQNTTSRPLMGCLDYPRGYRFLGADKSNGGLITVSDGGCAVTNEFVLPPGRDLVWRQSVSVPKKVTPGPAKIWYVQGISRTDYAHRGSDSSYLEIYSTPLDVTILASKRE